jgi:periplasmic protein TonB
VTDDQIANITYDMDPVNLEEPTPANDFPLPEGPMLWDPGSASVDKDRLLKYCVIASLILHVLAFTVVPRMAQLQPSSSLLKPGEKRTPIRMVQLPQSAKKEEPPPPDASAMSDRNHTALKERLPKAIPTPPRPPIGKPEPLKQRMASVMPPPAPEAFVKERQESQKKPEAVKPATRPDKSSKNDAPKPPARTSPRKKDDFKNHKLDMRPTAEDMAKGFSAQAGGQDFYPDGEVEEAIVDINTREDRFFSYLLSLKRKIEAVWIYPQTAARAGLGGTLTLEFVIAKEGKLEHVNLLDSSGHAILDESAQSAIKAAAPYNPFPPSLRAKRLRIRANFIYVTSDFFKRVL